MQRSVSQASLHSVQSGDSRSEFPVIEADLNDPHAAADDGANDAPAVAVAQKDTSPVEAAVAADRLVRSAVLQDRANVGNVGIFLGNWGLRASNPRVQRNIANLGLRANALRKTKREHERESLNIIGIHF